MLARHEVRDWPVVGWCARRFRTLYVNRERLSLLPAAVADVAQQLRAGRRVTVFPEGTTSCGVTTGHQRRFRPAFFQAAIDAGVPVYAMRIAYRHCADGGDLGERGYLGPRTPAAAFLGAEQVPMSLWRIAKAPGVVAELVCQPALATVPTSRRGELAARCQRQLMDAS